MKKSDKQTLIVLGVILLIVIIYVNNSSNPEIVRLLTEMKQSISLLFN